MMATDYDAPRKTEEELNEDSIEELKTRRNDKNSGKVDEDETAAVEEPAAVEEAPRTRPARKRSSSKKAAAAQAAAATTDETDQTSEQAEQAREILARFSLRF